LTAIDTGEGAGDAGAGVGGGASSRVAEVMPSVTLCIRESIAAAAEALGGDRYEATRHVISVALRIVCQFPGTLTLDQLISLLNHIIECPDPPTIERLVEMMSPMLGDDGNPPRRQGNECFIGDARNKQIHLWLCNALDIKHLLSAHIIQAMIKWLQQPTQRACTRLLVDVAVPLLGVARVARSAGAPIRGFDTVSDFDAFVGA